MAADIDWMDQGIDEMTGSLILILLCHPISREEAITDLL